MASGSRPVFMCVHTHLFAGCYLLAYSHCAAGVNILTLTHTHAMQKANPHQSSPPQCCWPAICLVLSDCWVQESGMLVWPRSDKVAAPSLFCLSFTLLHQCVPPSTLMTHRLHSTDTCSHSCCLCLKSPVLAGVFVCLCPYPHHLPPYPEPPAMATAEHCACVPVFLQFWPEMVS